MERLGLGLDPEAGERGARGHRDAKPLAFEAVVVLAEPVGAQRQEAAAELGAASAEPDDASLDVAGRGRDDDGARRHELPCLGGELLAVLGDNGFVAGKLFAAAARMALLCASSRRTCGVPPPPAPAAQEPGRVRPRPVPAADARAAVKAAERLVALTEAALQASSGG